MWFLQLALPLTRILTAHLVEVLVLQCLQPDPGRRGGARLVLSRERLPFHPRNEQQARPNIKRDEQDWGPSVISW